MMPVSMVGRAVELAELTRAWARLSAPVPGPAAAGRGIAVVTGEAGSGKSLLVRCAIDAMAPAPGTVLSGGARVHSPAPYDWLAAVLSGRGPDGLDIPPDALAWLAQQPSAPARRYAPGALLRLAVRTVQSLAGAGPAVIVIEDLHALDPASLNLVGELAATPNLPALLLVTSRLPEEGVSPRLVARTLARLTGAPDAIRQHLHPLTESEVSVLLGQAYGGPVPAQVVEAAYQSTGGNPYRLTELVATEPRPQPAAQLTAREAEVLACLAAGMSNKQVARSLGISIRTVTVHVSNLLRKTRSASRTEAALWAVRHQMADSSPSS
jgi:DNA-binding CsgD family transcriptional regulator